MNPLPKVVGRKIRTPTGIKVTPVLNEDKITFCVENKISVFPGAFTPVDVYKVWKLGATAVKVSPASQFAPRYLKELKAPLNKIKLLPTVGVPLDNLEYFLRQAPSGQAWVVPCLTKK